ncbi:MAG: hypothetical protein AAF799_43200 [Myxococcota bacterium]
MAGAVVALVGSGCAAPNLSRTVGRGNSELHASAGGPFAAVLGPPLPVPHANVGGRVGVSNRVDLDGNVNLLAMAFQILAFDVAANVQLYRRRGGLAVAGSTRLYLMGDLDEPPATRLYPELGLHAGGPVPRVDWLHLYGGQTLVVSPNPPRDGSAVFWTPFFGVEFLLPYQRARRGRTRQHGIAIHTAWMNPHEQRNTVLDYQPSRGAIAVHLGYRLRFGGLDR